MKELNKLSFNLAMVLVIVAGLVFVGWQWVQVQKIKAIHDVIQGCAAAATASGNGGFNGAVYNVCVTDKGFHSSLQ